MKEKTEVYKGKLKSAPMFSKWSKPGKKRKVKLVPDCLACILKDKEGTRVFLTEDIGGSLNCASYRTPSYQSLDAAYFKALAVADQLGWHIREWLDLREYKAKRKGRKK